MIDEFAVSDQLWVRLITGMIFSACVWWRGNGVVMGVLC